MNRMCVKSKIIVVVLICLLVGTFFFGIQKNVVKAESGYQLVTNDESSDFAYVEVSGEDVKAWIGCVPDIDTDITDGYLFAGYFKTTACTSADAVRASADVDDTATYYAKYIPEQVLSIYAQLSNTAGIDSDGNTTRNIRFVSSVDSLTYQEVGFKLEVGNESKYNNSTTVFEKIASSTNGDEFTFGPKIISTDSEYFVTAKCKDVLESDTSGFYVRAYIKTLNGVTVYGPSRYVTMADGLSNTQVIIPIKGDVESPATVTYNNAAATATAEQVEVISNENKDTDDEYTHLRITLADTIANLDSVTTFAVGGTTLTSKYRCLNTTNPEDESADTSWFTQYSGESKFVIASVKDLYGLAYLANTDGETFAGETIYMASDIELNEGWTAVAKVDNTTAPSLIWTPIVGFAGTFDGEEHIISGIYTKSLSGITGIGLFTQTNNATIKNLKITNSHFRGNSDKGTGAVVGCGTGTFENIYVEAFLYDKDTKGRMGGIVGIATGDTTFQSCWNNSSIETNGQNAGGLLGYTNPLGSTILISHCLNTGSVTYTGSTHSMFGGLVGRASSTGTSWTGSLTIEDSLSVGVVSGSTKQTYMGAVLGAAGGDDAEGNATVVVTNTYCAVHYDDADAVVGIDKAIGWDKRTNKTGCDIMNYTNYIGEAALTNAPNLDYVSSENSEGFWKVREGKIPMLTNFMEWSREVETE